MASGIVGKIDVNEFAAQAAKAARSLDANTAVIHNDSGGTVRFYCYNGGDLVMTVPFSSPTIADGYSGLIAAGGSTFKVYPDNAAGTQILVKPRHAYVFDGVGKVREL